MPTLPQMPAHDRFFARLERFQLSCPNCLRLLTSWQDQGALAKHFRAGDYAPKAVKYRRRMRTVKAVQYLVFNPFTQRLTCPWCNAAFHVGLVAYPVQKGGVRPSQAPPDTLPTRTERLELARLAGGWLVEQVYKHGGDVNLHVAAPCSCPRRGMAPDCALHGQPQPQPQPTQESALTEGAKAKIAGDVSRGGGER
jgi:hypothetical protein